MGSDHKTVVKIGAVRIRNVKSVLHLTSRMVCRHIQRIKVMKLVFNVRPFGNLKSHLPENSDNLFINFAHRMNTSLVFRTTRQGHVNFFLSQLGIQLFCLQLGLAVFQRVFNLRLENVQSLAHFFFLFNRKRSQSLHHFGNAPLFAENGNSGLFQHLNVRRTVNLRHQFVF